MAQLILNIENPAILPSLRKVLGALEGVSIVKQPKRAGKKSELDLAIEEAENGVVTYWKDVDSLISHINAYPAVHRHGHS